MERLLGPMKEALSIHSDQGKGRRAPLTAGVLAMQARHTVLRNHQAAHFPSTNPEPRGGENAQACCPWLAEASLLPLAGLLTGHKEAREAQGRWTQRVTKAGPCGAPSSQGSSEGTRLMDHLPATGATQAEGG